MEKHYVILGTTIAAAVWGVSVVKLQGNGENEV